MPVVINGSQPKDTKAKAYPGVPIYGGSDKIPALTNLVKDNSEFTVGTETHIKYA